VESRQGSAGESVCLREVAGPRIAPGPRGLDSAGVHRGRADPSGRPRQGFLTAWIPCDAADCCDRATFGVPDDRFLRVRARRAYHERTA